MTTALLLVLICAPVKSDQAVDTLVVCPVEFHQALAPWLTYRRQQGRRVAVMSNMQSAEGLREAIRHTAAAGNLRYVVLVGDAEPAMANVATVRQRCVPTHHSRAVVNVKFGSSPEIATDNWYADVDDDRLPDLAVGRLPCDSPAELTALVARIIAYEQSDDFGAWRRQVNFVAGLGGFGVLADAMLEASAKSLITAGIPAAFATSMTYGSWQSPYCPDPRRFADVALERLNEGSLFWVYIGHGEQRAVDQVRVPGASYPILSCADAPRLACQHAAPIVCFLACYSGAYDQPQDCLAEDMLRSPGGPVAVLCGSRVTMPVTMAVMGSELLQKVFQERAETLGEAFLTAKRRMVEPSGNNRHRTALEAVAKAMSPTAGELEAERAEHLDLFNLLGDPLLRLPFPQEIQVQAPALAAPGETIAIAGVSPVTGKCVVELVVRRDRLAFQPPRRGQFDPQALDLYGDVYRRANEPRLAWTDVEIAEGRFDVRLTVPANAKGACHVRVFVEGTHACAAGAADLRVELPANVDAK